AKDLDKQVARELRDLVDGWCLDPGKLLPVSLSDAEVPGDLVANIRALRAVILGGGLRIAPGLDDLGYLFRRDQRALDADGLKTEFARATAGTCHQAISGIRT